MMISVPFFENIFETLNHTSKIDSRFFLQPLWSSFRLQECQNAMDDKVLLEIFSRFLTFIKEMKKEFTRLFGAYYSQIHKIWKEFEDISAFERVLVIDKNLLEWISDWTHQICCYLDILLSDKCYQRSVQKDFMR